MAHEVLALTDLGATRTRTAIFSTEGDHLSSQEYPTHPEDYEGAIERLSRTLQYQSRGVEGTIVAGSMAIAAEVGPDGTLTKAGALRYTGKRPGADLADALNLEPDAVGIMNDVVAIARSQQHVNGRSGRPVDGVAFTLSSGFNDADYFARGDIRSHETGHDFFKRGASCACGEEGCIEAFISGKGIEKNHRVPSEEWLKDAENRNIFVGDLSRVMVDLVKRDWKSGFYPYEVRWTGAVALGQPFVMDRVASIVQTELRHSEEVLSSHIPVPMLDSVTLGEQAGLHGVFVDAQQRAQNI